ncbi:transposase [Mangrovicoccus sp. HB161399]|uniref:transposase n=1 Tax=Mangrovicoccus sp. HB161399 TaxID=2720392 RepID=UPI0015569AB1|nr:transposase [Mangrovicoccus sp. HB161399]
MTCGCRPWRGRTGCGPGDRGRQFRNGREFAAWLGPAPGNNSSGGKERPGRITKMGDRHLRRLPVVGMASRAIQVKIRPDRGNPRPGKLPERKPFRRAAIAMASKAARIIWTVPTREETWSPGPARCGRLGTENGRTGGMRETPTAATPRDPAGSPGCNGPASWQGPGTRKPSGPAVAGPRKQAGHTTASEWVQQSHFPPAKQGGNGMAPAA